MHTSHIYYDFKNIFGFKPQQNELRLKQDIQKACHTVDRNGFNGSD